MRGLDPRSRWNATALAFLGDSVWGLYFRHKHYSRSLRVTTYQERVGNRVNNVNQAAVLEALQGAGFLSEAEAGVVQWAVNSDTVKPPRHLDSLTYKRATALEAIVGYLYLTDLDRLQQLFDRVEGLQLSSPPAK